MEEQSPGCYCRVVPLQKILPNRYAGIMEKTVQNTSEIVREAYQFWKAFCLFQLEEGNDVVVLDRTTAKLVFKVIAYRKGMERDNKLDWVEEKKLENPEDMEEAITCFYINHYRSVQKTKFSNPGKDILDSEITQMITAIDNHIKCHFYNYIKRLAFSIIPKKAKNARSRRSKLLKDLWENTRKSQRKFHGWIEYFGKEIVESREILYSNPQGCLPLLYRINRVLEEFEEKTFAWLPLRKSLIPGSFSLSKTICNGLNKTVCKELKGLGELNELEEVNIWNEILELIRKLRIQPKKGRKISSIRTAGSSASIIFTPIKKGKRSREELKEQYIDQLPREEILRLQEKTIVAADPNKGNLLQMVSEDGIRFRYTAQQRRFETHSARYRKIRLEREMEVFSAPSLDGETVGLKEAIKQMKEVNSRTSDFQGFMKYVEEKNLFAEQFRDFYFEMWHRKFKFNTFINEKRSKDRFLNKFQSLYGTPQTTVLCVGDWEQRPGISFGKASTMGVGIRNWFRKKGYEVYLVDECRTSLTCCKCKHENEYNWQTRKDPRPWMQGKSQKVWGLSRCQNSQCRIVHNRDNNSSDNILEICQAHLMFEPRPEYFKRNYNHHNCASSHEGNSNELPEEEDLTVDGLEPIPQFSLDFPRIL